MNKYIKEQLEKCKVATIPLYDENSVVIIIPKNGTIKIVAEYEIGKLYQIYVEDSLIKPGNWYSTLHGNWNNGIGPKENILNVRIEQLMGKMIKVSSVDVNNYSWVGWLPKSNIKKLKDL